MTLEPVRPVRPVAPYIGGKRALASKLVERIDAIPHSLYAEPFVGMGGVFFRRKRRPRKEVINDISSDVVTLFRLLQRHYQQLLDVLKWQVCSRAEFDRLLALDPDNLTDLERAARFLYLQRASFGGKVTGRAFGVDLGTSARFDLTKLVPLLEDVHERLCGVDIERLTYPDLIERYDREGTLFYLDPPYHGTEETYGKGLFSTDDFDRLSDILAGIKGRFILSINATPEMRRIFARFACEDVQLNYRISGKVTPVRELIVSGP
ncbi:MAG: DNA adenine methylase [Sphingomonadaceae bacterium]|nr:DNA adenine methylase [Sphingomonadaceae bacterium]MCP5383504.1 DNA adenine methylase [Altererythrobacter sp.]MCP5392197.1 DNA adenine methylase [Sphingomonadaceae bacterium]MCP5394446.1 DNA adenine methylase [Sphingomonadaceae bacterium]